MSMPSFFSVTVFVNFFESPNSRDLTAWITSEKPERLAKVVAYICSFRTAA
jgi:hypothetical protein